MNTWNSIAWFPICVGLTAAGLVVSWFTFRRRGLRRGIRGVAWSLLPLALYLTGSILLVGRIGSAIVQFSSAFVFSPKTYAVILFVLAAVIFVTSGGIPLLSSRKRRARKKELKQQDRAGGETQAAAGSGSRAVAQVGAAKPAKQARPGKGGGTADDGLDDDVMEILRRRGIN